MLAVAAPRTAPPSPFPGLGGGNTFLAVALASACVWFFHYLIARGVRQAAAVNRIVTVAKLVPIVVFSTGYLAL